MFKNFCRCNATASDLYDGKSKNKIAVAFFFLIPMAAAKKFDDSIPIVHFRISTPVFLAKPHLHILLLRMTMKPN